jgi:3-oxoacyl-[acyl-carrier-protein] synthase II
MPHDRDAVITGIGLISCLGEGVDAHWAALNDFAPVIDDTAFPGYRLHPMAELALDKHISKREQRQMEPWQRFGTYAAGAALEAAGVKGNTELLSQMHMIVAAGGGERDYDADAAIMSGLPKAADPDAYLNEHLLSDLRPTLFLAQLSNLLAGNISLVHGVVGSSRTFMGEEASGADAIRIACARIGAGQGDLFLVGGSYSAQRPDGLLQYEMGRLLWKQPFAGIWDRQAAGGGMLLGSLGCFLVVESRSHAAARGATALARIASVASDRCRRGPNEATANARKQLAALDGTYEAASAAVISGASGAHAATTEEHAFLTEIGLPVRAGASACGHSMEPAFIANIALAAMAVSRGTLFPPLDSAEKPMDAPLRDALVTGWGHWRGEALAHVTTP